MIDCIEILWLDKIIGMQWKRIFNYSCRHLDPVTRPLQGRNVGKNNQIFLFTASRLFYLRRLNENRHSSQPGLTFDRKITGSPHIKNKMLNLNYYIHWKSNLKQKLDTFTYLNLFWNYASQIHGTTKKIRIRKI